MRTGYRSPSRFRASLVGLLSLAVEASFHTTPVQTVLADFPHTAFGRALGQRHVTASGYFTVPRSRWSPRFQKKSRVHFIDSPALSCRPARLTRKPRSREYT